MPRVTARWVILAVHDCATGQWTDLSAADVDAINHATDEQKAAALGVDVDEYRQREQAFLEAVEG